MQLRVFSCHALCTVSAIIYPLYWYHANCLHLTVSHDAADIRCLQFSSLFVSSRASLQCFSALDVSRRCALQIYILLTYLCGWTTQERRPACNQLCGGLLVVMIDCNFAPVIVPVFTTIFIVLAPVNSRLETFWYRLTLALSWKTVVKQVSSSCCVCEQYITQKVVTDLSGVFFGVQHLGLERCEQLSDLLHVLDSD